MLMHAELILSAACHGMRAGKEAFRKLDSMMKMRLC